MSRSRRKPYFTEQNSGKPKYGDSKRRAARAVRQAPLEEVTDGSAFKKEFNSWDIRDWSFYAPKDKKASRK